MKVIADDFVTIGFGDTVQKSATDHDRNLKELLFRFVWSNVRLADILMHTFLVESMYRWRRATMAL